VLHALLSFRLGMRLSPGWSDGKGNISLAVLWFWMKGLLEWENRNFPDGVLNIKRTGWEWCNAKKIEGRDAGEG
jgi:hypothetical protein